MPPRPGYTPSRADFWGTFFDRNGLPSELFARLCDSLFYYVDENCNEENATNGTGKLEYVKVHWMSRLRRSWRNEPPSIERSLAVRTSVFCVQLDHYGAKYAWDTVDADGWDTIPTLDRMNFLLWQAGAGRTQPDQEHSWWNDYIEHLGLRDPVTGEQFPQIPRSAFPLHGRPVEQARLRQAIQACIESFVTVHTPNHTLYKKLVTTSGRISCDVCETTIHGSRYRCNTCLDYDECDRCFYTSKVPVASDPAADANAPPPYSAAPVQTRNTVGQPGDVVRSATGAVVFL